jgi:hypothetical protein
MKKTIITIFGSVILFVVLVLGLKTFVLKSVENNNDHACTEEAKICPDGSTVGRTGANCEFSPCPELTKILTEAEARLIGEKNCIKDDESLSPGYYNENSKTWWFDANLNSTKEGCHPACVVFEDTKTAEINWRCTGLISPK